jgi:hypothetical protein
MYLVWNEAAGRITIYINNVTREGAEYIPKYCMYINPHSFQLGYRIRTKYYQSTMLFLVSSCLDIEYGVPHPRDA